MKTADDILQEEQPHLTRLWSHISDGEWLEGLGMRMNLGKGEVLIKADEVPRYCYYILKGRVVSYEYTVSGRERNYIFNEAGSLLLEANLLMHQAPPVSFVTLTPVIVLRISREELVKRIYVEPEVAFAIISSISYKFLTAMEQVRETTHHNASWKVCNLLLSFSERYGEDYDGKVLIREKISQQMLANLLGVNRITLVRIIKTLKELLLIEQVNGYYCIRNVDKLAEYMESQEGMT